MSKRRPRALGHCPATGKAQFTRGDAQVVARARRRRDHDNTSAYACRECPHWHIGHQLEHRRRRGRA